MCRMAEDNNGKKDVVEAKQLYNFVPLPDENICPTLPCS